MKSNIPIVILAAGKSSRLGQPKQLLPFKGKYLINHCIKVAQKVSDTVIVVTGAEHERIDPVIQETGVLSTFNEQWEEGMASSIRHGLSTAITQSENPDQVIFMVCDQPFVTEVLLESLLTKHASSGKDIVGSSYAGITGTPVLFDKTVFPELMELRGDVGARKIIIRDQERVCSVEFALGNVDMDTADDYKKLMMQKNLM